MTLESYYDRSEGKAESGPLTVVGGYISTRKVWVEFDVAWKAYLDRHGLACFHMTDFVARKKDFKSGWDEPKKRREFLEGLVDIIQLYAFAGFAVGVHREDFKKFAAPMALSNSMRSEYGFCGLSCARKALTWALKEHWTPPIQSIFEDGDRDQAKLVDLFRWDDQPVPMFKPKVPRTPADSLEILTPLQAADFVAYEVMRANRFLADGKGDWTDVRASCRALERRPTCYWFVATARDLKNYGDHLADAARRAKQPHPGDVFF